MQIAGLEEAAEARRLFEQEWTRRHGSALPPALYPERPEDALWREADQIMNEAWAKAQLDIGLTDDFGNYLSRPRWTATAGWITCPKNHTLAPSDDYCPKCGDGPVPAGVKLEAEEAAAMFGVKVGLAYLRGL